MTHALAVQRATRRLMAAASALRRLAVEVPDGAPSNCIVWAVGQHARQGGAIILTDSAYGNWFHGQWRAPDGRVWAFEPLVPKPEVLAGTKGAMPTLFVGTPVEVASVPLTASDSCRVLGRFVPGFTP